MADSIEREKVMKMRFIILVLVGLLTVQSGYCERIKDIVDIQGVRSNPLSGVGLVIGLSNTGDSTLPSQQMLANILRDSGIVISSSNLKGGNVALVMVTAKLNAFARNGSGIDVDVSSMGDAKSLQGGMLLSTALRGLDGQVYAIAQGGVSIGGWTASGDKASISKNHQTVGRIPNGATVEKEEIADYVKEIGGQKYITFNLRNSDFSTARHIKEAIDSVARNTWHVRRICEVLDAGTVRVRIPGEIERGGIAGFIDTITQFDVKVDMPAIVVVNERTGTIVVGEHVGISAVAISQGSLVVKVKETAMVSQPTAPFSDAGTTVKVPETMVGVQEQEGRLIPVSRAITVSELARTLNAIGATPRDIIAIFNALKRAGALQAKLEIM